MKRTPAAVLLGAVLLATLTACTTKVAAADVEKQISDKLGSQVGGVLSVTCPGDLTGEVGAKITCTMTTSDSTQREVHVTVTSVDGSQVNFDMQAPPAG